MPSGNGSQWSYCCRRNCRSGELPARFTAASERNPAKISGFFCRLLENHQIANILLKIRRNQIFGTSLIPVDFFAIKSDHATFCNGTVDMTIGFVLNRHFPHSSFDYSLLDTLWPIISRRMSTAEASCSQARASFQTESSWHLLCHLAGDTALNA